MEGILDGTKPVTHAEAPLSDAIALVVTDEQGRVLILWHGKHKFWTVPLGKVEPGEPEINAAYREALEELGIVSDHMELFETIYKPKYIDDCSGITISLFKVLSYSGTITNCEPEKHGCFQFVEPSEIASLGPTSFPTQVLAARFCHTT